MDSRPTINTIMKMLNKDEYIENMLLQVDNTLEQITMIPINSSPIIKPNNTNFLESPVIKPISEESFNRIHELEEEVFRLESIIKEKELNRSSLYCCFDTEDDDCNVTGRGKTNKGYEKMSINTEYFTPPDTKYSKSLPEKICEGSSYGLAGKPKSFLSSSLDKFTSFFTRK